MAEKEERILITKIQPECKFRELHETTAGGHTRVDFMCGKFTIKKLSCDEKCFEQCEWKELTGISRQEAIEKMAKSNWIATVCAKNQCVPVDIAKERWDEEWAKLRIDYKKVYYAGAEAALNALLEEDK